MTTKIFINLPVKNLSASVEFFTKLDFKFNAQFTGETAACLIISDSISVMLVNENELKKYTKKEITDATKNTEVILSLMSESKENVDVIINKALQAGATTPNEKLNTDTMYGWIFQDLDGHLWEIMWMDPATIK